MEEELKGETSDSPPEKTTADTTAADSSSAQITTTAEAKSAEPTVESIVQGVIDKLPKEEAQPLKEVVKEESDGAAKPDAEKKVEEKDLSTSAEQEKGPVPYDRFKEKLDEAQRLSAELTPLKPLAEAAQRTNEYLARHGVSQEEFQDALDTLVLLKTNPQKALQKLSEVSASLRQFDENTLPPETAAKIDRLKARVDEGELSASAARELEDAWRAQARHEVQNRLGTRRTAQTEAEKQKAQADSMIQSVNQWDSALRKTDPDYKPKAKPTDPDGLFEIARKGFMYELGFTPVRNANDLIAVLEKSYNDAKTLFSTRLAPKATKPAPTANGSHVSQPRKAPETDDEVVADVLKRNHGIIFVPRASA